MKVEVMRQYETANSTISLVGIDGKFHSYALEPPKGSRIPAGTYQAIKQPSAKFSAKFNFRFYVPVLQNVPGHTAIEIHIGNYPRDTEGCLLLGYIKDTDFVGNSENAFFDFMAKTNQMFDVEYTDSEVGNESV
jgi:hypothetical protein